MCILKHQFFSFLFNKTSDIHLIVNASDFFIRCEYTSVVEETCACPTSFEIDTISSPL